MDQPSGRRGGAPAAALVIAVGAIVGLVSVFLPWAAITEVTFEGGEVFGEVVGSLDELGPGILATADQGVVSAAGLSDTAGLLAGVLFVAALAAAAAAASRSRGLGALLALASGVLALVLALTSLFRSYAIATAAFRDDLYREATDLVPDPLLGGLARRIVDETLGLFSFESSPGLGVYLAIGAALVVVVGGWLAIPPEAPRQRVPGERPAEEGRPPGPLEGRPRSGLHLP